MAGYRLIQDLGRGAGRTHGSFVYSTPLEAVEAAEHIMRLLEPKPHRRPHTIRVEDVWTGETVATIRLDVPRDPGVCPTCGANTDPFASLPDAAQPPVPAAGPGCGHVPGSGGGKPEPDPEGVIPPAEAESPPGPPGDRGDS